MAERRHQGEALLLHQPCGLFVDLLLVGADDARLRAKRRDRGKLFSGTNRYTQMTARRVWRRAG